jgi:hypothetical protein
LGPSKDDCLDVKGKTGNGKVSFLKNPAATKLTHLIQSRVSQFNRYACSAASVAIIINAIRCGNDGGAEKMAPITQQELLAVADAVHWQDKLSHKGYQGRHGVLLSDLEIICKAVLDAYAISYKTVDTLTLNETMPKLHFKKREVHHQLIEMAASAHDYILAYFTQGTLVGDWFGSHVSPVATFNPDKQTVLMLDVDPEIEKPYLVSFDRFFKSLIGSDNTYHRRGGGWVRIRI